MILLKGGHACDPQTGLDEVVDIALIGNRIAAVRKHIEIDDPVFTQSEIPGASCSNVEVIDCTGKTILPGLLDMHVHFREPGFEYKEDITSGSRAAAHGGFTDVATMPNTNPITDSGVGITYQCTRADEVGLVNIHPIGALTKDEKGEELSEVGDMIRAGAVGFSDDGHGVQSASMMRTCMKYISQFNRPVIAHCEIEELSGKGVVNAGRVATRLGMFGWPGLAEEAEVARDIDLCRTTGCPLHIAHISTKRSLELVKEAKAEGLPVTCEVTPMHLFLTENDIDDTYNTNFKMNPPLRTPDDAAALIEGVIDGSIDAIVSDHAPHAEHEKNCEFEIASFGCIGLETTLPLLVTNLVATKRMDYLRLAELLAYNPRKILRLDPVVIQEGSTASLTVIDENKRVVLDTDYFVSKAKNSPFIGQELQGVADCVIKDGAVTLKGGIVQNKQKEEQDA